MPTDLFSLVIRSDSLFLLLLQGVCSPHSSLLSVFYLTSLTSYVQYQLKVPDLISQNGDFYSNDASPPKKSWFQISVKSVKQFGYVKRLCILQLPIPYCVSLITVTITSHIFINIFQTVHFPSVRFTRGNEKNTSFLLIPKSPKVWEKSEVIRPDSFKGFIELHVRQASYKMYIYFERGKYMYNEFYTVQHKWLHITFATRFCCIDRPTFFWFQAVRVSLKWCYC